MVVGLKGAGLFTLLMLFSLTACTPYSNNFSCPGTYPGVCESMQDSYADSVAGIDPREFDPKYQEKKKKWEEAHKNLIEARMRAASTADEALEYRQTVFQELKRAIEQPQTPILVPPKVQRALILGHGKGRMFTAPHFVFFTIDEPKWVYRKMPEKSLKVGRYPTKPEANVQGDKSSDEVNEEEVSD